MDNMHSDEDDSACCGQCELEVSPRTCEVNPSMIHLEQRPRSNSGRSIHSSSYSRSWSTADLQSQNPSKRQKIEVEHNWKESNIYLEVRERTFSHWTLPKPFCCRLLEAGFSGCNVRDRVICMYCDLICEEWNVELDDPCKVHQVLSPNCLFVKSMLKNKLFAFHLNYIDREKRLETFATWSNQTSLDKNNLAYAGFFLDNFEVKCFYCNGSLAQNEVRDHPLTEHIRWFPYCKYARQLCGEDLYEKLRRAVNSLPENIKLENQPNQSNKLEEAVIPELLLSHVDYNDFRQSLYKHKFHRSIIQHCFEDQFQLKREDFVTSYDLFIACLIYQKQMDFEHKRKRSVKPNEVMQRIYGKSQVSNNNNHHFMSYADVLKIFENELQTYQHNRQVFGQTFVEETTLTIEREQSLKTSSNSELSPSVITAAGWIKYNNYFKCPHCYMKYDSWEANDDPLFIHKQLSPLCLFVLSTNPFNSHSIPTKEAEEHYTDEDIENAELQPYKGLVQTRPGSMSEISERLKSFQHFPTDFSSIAEDLAMSGIYFISQYGYIQCFYCKFVKFIRNQNIKSIECFKSLHHLSSCRYIQQMKDNALQVSTEQASNTCQWCLKEDKQLMAIPCRHFCLCKKCGQTKRLCPKCQTEVTKYVIVYRA
ncbi:hypothetical protein I4U23_014930 [Adineta vaga]|nr:hypothetical protein I4U23_014930 [Adineta vaga]